MIPDRTFPAAANRGWPARLLAAWLALFLSVAASAAGPAQFALKQGDLGVTVDVDSPALAEKFGPRFDRTGFVSRIEWNGHSFLGQWGMPDEFGFAGNGVLGFGEAGAGDPFIKIGVGRLRRTDEEKYGFATRYPVECAFPVEAAQPDGRTLVVSQTSDNSLPWRYRYEKTYQLSGGNTLAISYALTNLGSAPFSFEHYNHHFFAPDGKPVDAGWELETGLLLATPKESPYRITPHLLQPASAPAPRKAMYYRTRFDTAEPLSNRFTLQACGLAIDYTGHFRPSEMAVYAEDRIFCPEIFHVETVDPGMTVRWTATYRFRHSDPAPGTPSGPLPPSDPIK